MYCCLIALCPCIPETLVQMLSYIIFFNLNLINLFIFGCVLPVALHRLSLLEVGGGYSLVAVHGFLIVAASFVVEHRL